VGNCGGSYRSVPFRAGNQYEAVQWKESCNKAGSKWIVDFEEDTPSPLNQNETF